MTKRRRNPVYLDPQPSLFAGEPDFSHRIEWKNATASQLMSAAESEYLTEDEIDEIDKILDLIEEEGVEAAIAAGVNPVLARDLNDEFYNRLLSINEEAISRRKKNDEEAVSRRTKPLIDYIKGGVEAGVVANTAGEFNLHGGHRLNNPAQQRSVFAATEGGVEVDEVNPLGALGCPIAGRVNGVAVVGLGAELALGEAHGLALGNVDGGQQFKNGGRHSELIQLVSRRTPAAPDFSG
jgi:phosphoribosyl-ATP pyrophosphohydrolase